MIQKEMLFFALSAFVTFATSNTLHKTPEELNALWHKLIDADPDLFEGIPGQCECKTQDECDELHAGAGVINIRFIDPSSVCAKHNKICCEFLNSTESLSVAPQGMRKGCGYRNEQLFSPLMADSSQMGEFPWMAQIYEDLNGREVYRCGGSLINAKVVLTAAHCVTGKHEGKKFTVKVGQWDRNSGSEILTVQERGVKNVVVHEKYYAPALYNDVALLILNSDFLLTDNVNFVCLAPERMQFDGSRCLVTGYGKNIFGQQGVYQSVLKKIEVSVVDPQTCELKAQQQFGPNSKIYHSFICAGGEPGVDSCTGDGGSPLVCKIPNQPDRFQQIGIVSWGVKCGKNIPAFYTSVADIRKWIDVTMIFYGINDVYKY